MALHLPIILLLYWVLQKLVDVLSEVKDFMLSNPTEIITIIFQNDGGNIQLQKAIDSIDWMT
jgi:hypothetical protein